MNNQSEYIKPKCDGLTDRIICNKKTIVCCRYSIHGYVYLCKGHYNDFKEDCWNEQFFNKIK